MIGQIFVKSQNQIQDPAKLYKIIHMIDIDELFFYTISGRLPANPQFHQTTPLSPTPVTVTTMCLPIRPSAKKAASP
jgi:hypothetical protein